MSFLLKNEEREKQLRKYSDAYYNDEPLVPDGEFDALWRTHLAARSENPNDPTWRDTILDKVGAAPKKSSGFRKVRHATPMLSLDNVFEVDGNFDQAVEWLEKLPEKASVIVEPKMDGLSLSLVYDDGIFTSAVTRGNGEEGDDVTQNIHPGMGVPLSLVPDAPWDGAGTYAHPIGRIEVRGEVIMPVSQFESLNAELKAAGKKLFANPRNAAAGSLRTHDAAESKRRGLKFVAYSCSGYRHVMGSHSEEMARLNSVGFTTPPCSHASPDTDWNSLRYALTSGRDYQTDGLVLKVDSYEVREQLGFTSRAPRWAVALKFKQPAAITKLKAITVQTGRSGILTPVGELEPVEVDGSIISRVTLHNEDQINRLGIRVGDRVEVAKAGGVIPAAIRSVTSDVRRDDLRGFFAAKHTDVAWDTREQFVHEALEQERPLFSLLDHIDGRCPSCSSTDIQKKPVEGEEEGVHYQCQNPSCPAQLAGKILHMCSRKALDITGIGEEMADALGEWFRKQQIEQPIDLLTWSEDDLALISWETESGGNMSFGEKRAEKAVAAVRRALTLPMHRWLYALGIHSIGENTAKEISRLYANPGELLLLDNAPSSVIVRIAAGDTKNGDLAKFQVSSHLGPVSCNALLQFVRSYEGRAVLKFMDHHGVKSDNHNPVPTASADKPLTGKTVVITGTLSVSRDQMKDLVEKAGAKVSGSVSKKTDFLIAGEDCGSKLDKAKAAGVKILTEVEVRALL